jgi:hypothetical protein
LPAIEEEFAHVLKLAESRVKRLKPRIDSEHEHVIQQLSAGLAQLRDLLRQHDEIGQLADVFRDMIHSLNKIVADVVSAANTVAIQSQQMSSEALELSQGVSQMPPRPKNSTQRLRRWQSRPSSCGMPWSFSKRMKPPKRQRRQLLTFKKPGLQGPKANPISRYPYR